MVPFASGRSAGRTIDHGDVDLEVQALSPASIQGYDDLSYTVGRSSLRFGAGVERMRDNMISTANPNGNFNFNSLSDYLTNRPFSLGIAIPGTVSPRDLRQLLFAAYFQDDVCLRPNLTANLGLRYDIQAAFPDVGGVDRAGARRDCHRGRL